MNLNFPRWALVALLPAVCSQAGAAAPNSAAWSPAGDTLPAQPAAAATADPASTAPSGCRSQSGNYPWGRLELRDWTPRTKRTPAAPAKAPGLATGKPFSARLIRTYGLDTGLSSRSVELETADGCRRRFRTSSFVDADLAVLDAAQAQHPLQADPAHYAIKFTDVTEDDLAQQTVAKYETQHFVFWYGLNQQGDSYKWLREQQNNMPLPDFLARTGQWMELIWHWNHDVLGAPMPYAGQDERYKINVYVCATGLPFKPDGDLKDCGASAAESMGLSAANLRGGDNTLIHEFGHVIQFYTGGFRDRIEDGPIWETGAEWSSFTLTPDYVGFLYAYVDNLENGPLWSNARYAAYPFFEFLYGNDHTRPFFWKVWTDNLRNDEGASQEDLLQAFVRLGQAAGVYPHGFASFADDAGWYGARLAAMDFLDQRALLDAMAAPRGKTWAAHFHAPLARGADQNSYVSSPQRPLLEFGTHLIPLTGAKAGDTVRVTLTGATTANQAAWRFVLVAVGEDRSDAASEAVSYSALGAASGTGSGSIERTVPDDAQLYLAVTATPGQYETLSWQKEGAPTSGTQFPYRVQITGATPSTDDPQACTKNATHEAWNLNYDTNGNKEGGKHC